ncbi:MAG: hypothetical protein CL607_00535 [Anaerolineaceae bacterium]|nr:hypothetical protein [Anaerolineaceae bacterium]
MSSYDQLLQENQELRQRLSEAEDTLHAIRSGAVDALVVATSQGNQIYTLESADHPYRLLVEKMQEGAATITPDGTILYSNPYLARILEEPLDQLASQEIDKYIVPDQRKQFLSLLHRALSENGCHGEFECQNRDGRVIPLYISASPFSVDESQLICLILTDLTEKNRKENELRQSEARYRTVVTALHEGIILLDSKGVFQTCNPAAERILGLPADQIMGRTAYDPNWQAIHEDGSPFPSDTHPVSVTLKTGDPVSDVVMGVNTPDKTIRWLIINSQPLHDAENDDLLGVVASFTDITERKKAQAEINSLAKFPLENPQPILRLSGDGTILYANSSGQALLMELDVSVGDLAPAEWLTFLADTSASGSIEQMDFQYGDRFWSLQFVPISDMGYTNIYGMDITERRHAEDMNRFQAQLLDMVGQAVIATDMNANVTYWNRFAENLYGWSTEEAIGRSILELTPSNTSRQQANEIVESLQSGKTWNGEFTVQRKDGTTFPALISNSPVVDAEGTQIGIIGVSMDITERKKAEETIRRSESALKKAQRVARVGNWTWHIVTNRLEASDEMYRIFGIEKEAFSGDLNDLIERVIHPDDRAAVEHSNASVAKNKPIIPLEYRIVLSDGTERWIWAEAGEVIRDKADNPIMLTGIVQDITERKQAEEDLRKLNRTLTLLSNVNQTIVRVRDTSNLFDEACRIAIDDGGFRMAWIGMLNVETGDVKPIAKAGHFGDYLEMLQRLISSESENTNPCNQALIDGDRVVVNDIERDMLDVPWAKKALALGYRSLAAFPLVVAGETRGLFGLYSDQPKFFNQQEVMLLDEMAGDISFAMAFAEEQDQRQQAEQALRAQVNIVEDMRVFLQTTLDAFSAHTAVLASDGTIINVNESWVKFAEENGSPASAHYVGTNYLTICDTAISANSEEATPAADGIRAVIDGSRDAFYLDYPCHSPDEERWFSMHVTPFPESAPRRVVLAHMNITDKVLAAQRLEEQKNQLNERVKELGCLYEHSKLLEQRSITREALFQETANLIPTGMQYPDIACARLTVDDKSYSSEHFRETSWHLTSPIIVYDVQLGLLEVYYLEERPQQFEGPFLKEEVLLVNELSRRLGHRMESMEATSALQAAHDTLERRVAERTQQLQEAKERVEAILNNSVDPILLLDADLNIEQANPAFEVMFGYEQGEFVDISPVSLLADSNDVIQTISEARATVGSLSMDVEAQNKDGTSFPIELTIGFIEDGSYVCIIHDITQRKQIEESLRAAVEKERELNELKSSFVSMASHEFRTPLATIRAITDTLSIYRQRLTDDQIEQKLDSIGIQVDYLKDIMDDVLKLAQLQARRTLFNPESVNLDILCHDVIDEYINQPNFTHNIQYVCEGRLPIAQVDQKLIRQLISNLLSNAIKYSLEDQSITVRLEYDDGAFVLRVQDQGMGIPESDLKHLFEPFHRAANVGTIHGTGLGMTIVKESVDLHGGTIHVDSEIDVGTKVTVRIPLAQQGN